MSLPWHRISLAFVALCGFAVLGGCEAKKEVSQQDNPVITKQDDPVITKAGTQIGDRVDEIEGKDLDDTSFKLTDYRGKVVMLDFWSST